MINNNNSSKEDRILKELFKDFETGQPSADVKKNIMSQILHQWTLKPETTSLIDWKELWFWIIAGIPFLGILIYLNKHYSWLTDLKMESLDIDFSFFKQMENSIQTFVNGSFSFTMILLIVVISALLVLGFDTLFQKLNQQYHNNSAF